MELFYLKINFTQCLDNFLTVKFCLSHKKMFFENILFKFCTIVDGSDPVQNNNLWSEPTY